MDCRGGDGEGTVYSCPQEFWDEVEAARKSGEGPQWYRQAVDYWDSQEASNDGVLGGFEELSGPDLADSKAFLLRAFGCRLEPKEVPDDDPLCAIDCGAGIGRVTGALLLRYFQRVDLLEPSAHLLEKARAFFSGRDRKPDIPAGHSVVNYLQIGLEAWDPQPNSYDAIWIQWALLYLTDDDVQTFFARCAKALKPGGLIFAKENVCPEGFVIDRADYSITRSHKYYLELFDKSGLALKNTTVQTKFPKGLYKVRMYALAPKVVQ